MKNIKFIMAIVAILVAFSFTGKAFDLPFGDANMRQYGATNIGVVTVQCAQFDPESGAETIFYDNSFGISFKTYGEFMDYVRSELRLGEVNLKGINLVPAQEMVIYVGAGKPGADGTLYYNFSGFHFTRLVNVDGAWKFPAGFVNMFVPKLPYYSVIRLQKPVKWAKFVALDSVTDELKTLHDTRINQATDREVRVDSNANLLVRSDYCLNDTSKKVYLTVGYEDGTVQAWNGAGKEIPVPTPTLSLVSSIDKGLVLVLNHGNIGNTVKIQCSGDLKSWTNFQTFVTTEYVTRISITESSNPPSCFFRIAE